MRLSLLLVIALMLSGCTNTPHLHFWEGSKVCTAYHDPCPKGANCNVGIGRPCEFEGAE